MTRSIKDVFTEVDKIVNKKQRIETLREYCKQNNALAIVIQYTYSPNIKFDLPEGNFPEILINRQKGLTNGSFYYILNRFELRNVFTTTNIPKGKKEKIFENIVNSILPDDMEILMAMKEKNLPFKRLNRDFCVEALPELFRGQ